MLTQIEEEIDNIDRAWSRREAPDVINGSFRQDTQRERVDLIWEARRKLEDYLIESFGLIKYLLCTSLNLFTGHVRLILRHHIHGSGLLPAHPS